MLEKQRSKKARVSIENTRDEERICDYPVNRVAREEEVRQGRPVCSGIYTEVQEGKGVAAEGT